MGSGDAILGPSGWETRRGDLVTDGNGESRRYRVDVGQTGFFDGRMFRAYLEVIVPVAGPPVAFRFTSPVDFILFAQSINLTQGALRVEAFTGATESGVWTPITPIGVNRMSERPQPYYTPKATIDTGGAFTGGTAVDLITIRSSQQNASAQNVGVDTSERGLPAGVYHIRFSTLTGGLTVNDEARGTYSIIWEERD